MLLKPAVRGMTAAKNAASSLPGSSSRPSVFGLCHSVIRKTMMPMTSRAAVTATVILVSTDQRLGRRQVRSSSNTTGKPSPPAITAAAMVRQIHGSVTKRIRLSGHSAKPALLKAEIAWNTPRYKARPDGSS